MNSVITVYVCGNTPEELAAWTARFENFFGAATTVQAVGSWEGQQEPTNLVSHLYDKDGEHFDNVELSSLVLQYKHDANQDAVLVTRQPIQGWLY